MWYAVGLLSLSKDRKRIAPSHFMHLMLHCYAFHSFASTCMVAFQLFLLSLQGGGAQCTPKTAQNPMTQPSHVLFVLSSSSRYEQRAQWNALLLRIFGCCCSKYTCCYAFMLRRGKVHAGRVKFQMHLELHRNRLQGKPRDETWNQIISSCKSRFIPDDLAQDVNHLFQQSYVWQTCHMDPGHLKKKKK